MNKLSDPRQFPIRADADPTPAHGEWLSWIEQSLSSMSRQHSEDIDRQLERAIVDAFDRGDFGRVESALQSARSPDEYRHLWRAAIAAWRSRTTDVDATVVAAGFAIPVVIVAAADRDVEMPMSLSEPRVIVDTMKKHGALGGNQNFGIGGVLTGVGSIGLDAAAKWPSPHAIDAAAAWIDAAAASPVRIASGVESAHLRFILGTALASPKAKAFEERTSGAWGMAVAEQLSRQLAVPDVQVLALPGAPADALSAWQHGLLAHRDVALQLFASSALRKLRSSFGEPGVVVSAHRVANGGYGDGELRVSLSSPFGERDAEGFRCPLYPFERVGDVVKIIVDLLSACRVADITVLPGVHPERNADTGLPLFFRADSLPAIPESQLRSQ